MTDGAVISTIKKRQYYRKKLMIMDAVLNIAEAICDMFVKNFLSANNCLTV